MHAQLRWAALVFIAAIGGCGATIEPGHRGLLFDPRHGGLQQEVLNPGWHRVSPWARVDDFDTTYSTRKEEVRTLSAEGLNLDVKLAVIYRPIVLELYLLDTEIGPNYYDEVISPEFKSAARGVLARHSYLELQKVNDKIEDEIEAEVRRRIQGKHLDITSVTLESIDYAPEIAQEIRAKLVGEQQESRRRASREWDKQAQLYEAEKAQKQMHFEQEKARQSVEMEAEKAKAHAEALIHEKENERKVAEEQAAIDKLKAETEAESQITKARAQAEEETLMAKAHAAENRAQSTALTPLSVMAKAYEALGEMGGKGTTVMLGDWSHVPNFLFPRIGAFEHMIPSESGAEKPVTTTTGGANKKITLSRR